jgi:hypothetical protein
VFAAAVRQGQKGMVSALTKEERRKLREKAEKAEWINNKIAAYLKLIEDHLEAGRS